MDEVQDQTPAACTETELHDAADSSSAVTCRIVGEHTQHEAVTPSGGLLKWPDVEPQGDAE